MPLEFFKRNLSKSVSTYLLNTYVEFVLCQLAYQHD